MACTHWILQGKGGVGKSNIASQLMQYLRQKELAVFGYDTDPVNATFARYKAFGVTRVRLLEDQNINQRLLDPFMAELVALPAEAHAVIDNGASTFLPLCSYMAENPILPMLQEQGTVFLHTVVTGGQALRDTLDGFTALAQTFPETSIVVWLNAYFGDILVDGKSFEESEAFRRHQQDVHALVRIPSRNRDTYGKDLELLLAQRQTYEEAMNDPSWNIMARQRLQIMRREMAAELDKAQLI